MAGSANGVCKTAIENAVQTGPTVGPVDILENLSNAMDEPWATAGEVMALYQCALTSACDMCFP
jgi:hypothetical protein